MGRRPKKQSIALVLLFRSGSVRICLTSTDLSLQVKKYWGRIYWQKRFFASNFWTKKSRGNIETHRVSLVETHPNIWNLTLRGQKSKFDRTWWHEVTWWPKYAMLHISLCISARKTQREHSQCSISILSKVKWQKTHLTSYDLEWPEAERSLADFSPTMS